MKNKDHKFGRGVSFFFQKVFALFLVGFFTIGMVAPTSFALAEDPPADTKVDQKPAQSVTNFGEIASLLVSVFTPFVAVQVRLAGDMMSNDFILGNISDADQAKTKNGEESIKVKDLLQKMWQVVRDLVNYCFIVVLLIIAFMTVIDAGGKIGNGDNSFIKSALPRLVVGLVAVNMTWFAGMVILDVASVATNIVYALPKDIPGIKDMIVKTQKDCVFPAEKGKKTCAVVCDGIDLDAKKLTETDAGDAGNPTQDPTTVDGTTTYTYSWGTLNFRKFDWDKDFNYNSIASLFAFGFIHVEELPRASGNETKILDLAIGVIVALIVIIIITVAMTALTFALLERVIVIWINLILAPVGVLIWVISGFASGIPTGSDENGIGLGAFVRAAFLPAAIGAPLSIGFILIILAKSQPIASSKEGAITNLNEILPGVNTIYDIFWFVITIGVMWQSVAMAEKLTNYVKPAISAMKSGVEKVASFVVKAPMYLPWIPVKSGSTAEKVSIGGSLGAISGAMNQWQHNATRKAAEVLLKNDSGVGASPDLLRKFETLNSADKSQIEFHIGNGAKFADALRSIGKTDLADAYTREGRTGREDILKKVLTRTDEKGRKDILDREAVSTPVPSTPVATTSISTAAGKTYNINVSTLDQNSDAAAVAAAMQAAGIKRANTTDIQEVLDELRNQNKADTSLTLADIQPLLPT